MSQQDRARRGRRVRGPIASAAALAVVGAMTLTASPASAIPIDDVPQDPAQWATTPYSPLPAAEIAAPGNQLELTFDGTEGGLHDGADTGTGFTMIQPSSADNDYYLPENLAVADGALTITATKGIAYSNTGATGEINKQDNTLGVGVDAADTALELTTTLNSPTAATSSAQAGLWFGPDDENYVKLALIGSSATGRQIQLSREINGLTTNGSSAAPSVDQVMVDLNQSTIGSAPVTLTMLVNSATSTITGRYQVGDGAVQTLGTLALPADYHDGSLLDAQIENVTSFAGIYGTKRNMQASAPLAYAFEQFSVQELDTEAPAAPEGVSASAEPSQVGLSWTGAPVSSDVVGYRVYRSTTSPVATTGNGIGGASLLTEPQFTDTDVFIGSEYHYAVVAVDQAGNRSVSTETQASVPAVAGDPVALINFQTADAATPDGYSADTGAAYTDAAGSGWISATTSAPLDLSTLTRERTGASVTDDQRLATIIHMQYKSAPEPGTWQYDLPNGTYTVVAAVGDTGTPNGGGYDSTHAINAEGVQVIAPFNPSSSREYDEGVATVEVTDGTLTVDAVGGTNTKLAYIGIYAEDATPAAPQAPAGLAAEVTAGGVDLTWSAVEGAEGYNVFRSTDAAVPTTGTPLNAEPLTEASFTDATAEPGQTYFYAVVAVNAGGTSTASDAVEVTVPAEAVAPAAPADLTAQVLAGEVQLGWSAVEGAEGYNVFRSTDAAVPTTGTPLNTEPLTEASFTDATAEPGQTYFYAVVAVNAAGASDASAAVEVAVPAAPVPPAAPADLAAEHTTEGVTLTWSASAGATGYTVYRGIGAPASAEGDPLATVDVPGYADTDVQPGTTYHYLVVALNDDGASEPSNAASVEVPAVEQPGECTTGQWSAEYFNNRDLAGDAVLVECVDAVDADWKAGSPAGVNANNFSARYATTLDEGVGTYQFAARADDGIRVIVDGETVVDEWHASDGKTTHVAEVELTDGPHDVVVEYYEGIYHAEIHVSWTKLADGSPVCEPGEWSAQYYNNKALAGEAAVVDCVEAVDFTWKSASPEGVNANNFSARYATTVDEGAGTYQFSARADDGIRVIVDGETVVDAWHASDGKTTHVAEVELTDGPHDVVVEYYEGVYHAEVHVGWLKLGDGGPVCEPAQWSAQYYNNRDLAGEAALVECIDAVDLDWKAGSPAGVNANNFSARYATTVNEGAGTYQFSARADDGIRVIVDGETVVDAWHSSDGKTTHVAEVELTEGSHEVVVEYYEGVYHAEVHVAWLKLAGEAPVCEPGQWSGQYFNNKALAGVPALVECVEAVDFTWRTGSPEGIDANNFSARWTTTVNEGAGTYDFAARADDGIRVIVDGETVIDEWHDSDGKATYEASVELTDGPHEVVVEYYEGVWYAEAHVSYEKVDGTPDTSAPEAPTALTGTATDTVVDLTWQASVSADTVGYHVYRGTAPGVSTDGTPYSGASALGGTVFSDPAVSPGTTYYYVVTAVDAAGNESAPSTELEVTVEEIVAPADLVATSGTDAVELSWTASTTAAVTGYHVYRGTAPGVTAGGTPLNGDTPVAGTTYTDATAEVGTTYYYVVTAVDGDGAESAASNEATGTVTGEVDTEAPEPATGLTATAGDGVVDLAWTASASADTAGYRVYRSLEPNIIMTGELVSGDALVTGTTYADTAVTNGTTYFYGVRAVDGAGNESLMSNDAFGVPRVPNDLDVKVDFGAAGMAPAAGYVLDFGEAYGSRTGANQGTDLTYGWVDADGHALSLVGNGRDRQRTGVDERLDSILHMQYGDVVGTNGVDTEGIWEMAVPNGLYEVTVAVGDEGGTNGYDSFHVVNAEASVGIEGFQATAGEEYLTATTKIGVWDGRLTLSPEGGTNTKIAYVEVLGLDMAPHVDTVLPDNRGTDHDVTAGVSATIRIPYAGVGVDPTTLQGNVRLFEVATGAPVPVTVGTSGGNDVISLSPDEALDGNKAYRFVVTDAVKDNFGAAFVPFTSVFTTGSGEIIGGGEFAPLTGIEFEKVELPVAANKYWASFAFGPDGKLYGTTIGQGLYRMTVEEDGTLSSLENLGYQGRAMIGLVFDRSATADDLRLWVTSTSANIGGESQEWISGISLLEGPNLQTEHKVFTSLPRSQTDHLTNSIAYGPDGRLYFLQGSNQAAGDLDNSWGQRGEKLLTAAALVFDQDHPQVQAAAAGNAPIDVKTSDGGTYDPFAANAPLKIHATGIRNAYDLVWHSNGSLYVPTNGTAGGANSPGVTANADGTFTRVAAPGIPGYSSVNGQDVTDACLNRRIDGEPYTGGSVPAIANHPTQQDHLYRVEEHGYYGHPNPERCEWVLHEGNDPANPPTAAGQGGSKYPSGTKADPNYRGIAYNLGFNKSPNGALEYQADTFDGQLKGRLIVTRFSNNNDLIFLQADPATGEILGAQTSEGLTGVADSTMTGVDGFNDPLEVVEDPSNGNLYVNQYNRGGSDQKMYLLRVPEEHRAPTLETSAQELIFSAVKSTTSGQKSVTVTNSSTDTVTLAATISGANAGEFALTGTGGTLAPGASATFQVQFKPGTTVGQRAAILRLTTGDKSVDVGLYGLSMNGIEGGNEPTLHNVMGTLGYAIDVGWTNLAGGMDPAAKGDEILEPLFVRAGSAPATMTPLAQYAPREDLPFGWYTGDGGTDERHQIGSIDINGYQSLLPPVSPGSQTSFDPGTDTFGFYYFSNTFSRLGYTEDRLNSPASDAHRARIYPAKNRSGAPIANTYIVAFEDASNGDYQDYVFLVTGVKPAGEGPQPVTDAIKINFSNEAAALPAGYLRDFGEPFGSRARTDQGEGLTYGWKDQATENPINLSVGGTTGPGNGRDRATSQPDQRLDTLMHMQSGDITANGNTFNGVSAYAFWEIALPDGTYEVTVAAGDPSVNSDPEEHAINVENAELIAPFVPTGAVGANTRHRTATAQVTLSDGFLTIDANGGTNTKINYVDIVPVNVDGDDPSDGAQVKVAFGPSSAPLADGWVRESGQAYSGQRGYGWLDAATGQPVDRTVATRFRSTATTGIEYPADNRLKSFAFLDNASQPAYTNGVWEYEVPNGTYEVAVSVGDAGYLDSTHGVAAEGQPVIASFVPTGTTPFQTGVRTVTVTDGKLTVTNTGENTKVNWVSITGEGLDPIEPPTGEDVQIAFGPESAPLTSGWTREAGLAFSEARGFGWLDADTGQPVERTVATRYRSAATAGIAYPSDDRLKSFAFLDNATQSYTNGTWEYALGNGTYTVEASVGDAGYLDSTHGVAVEGVDLISGFTPSGSAPFAAATKTVEVADGRLTVTNTGTNTKLNYIRIAGESLGAPSVDVTLNGISIGSSYSGGPVQVAIDTSLATGATLESLTYSVNGGPATAYAGPFNLGVGNHVLEVTATDSAERTTTREISLEILDVGGTVDLTNTQVTRQGGEPVPGLSEDWLVLHKINAGLGAHKFPSTGTVTVTNTGAKDLRVTDIALTGSAASSFTLGALPDVPFTVAPGGSVPVTVDFTATTGGKGIRSAQVQITSSDAVSPITTFEVRGAYMTQPEGGNEITLNQVSALFGWTTDIGALSNGDEMRTSELNGDEVRSFQWKRMDSAKPVTARQIAAFHGCCGQQETINISGATATHHSDYGQSIYPLNNALSGPTQLTSNPAGNFNLTVSGQNTANTNYMAVKTWPVIDQDGKPVAGSWIVGHDYISSPNQCGVGPTNCDFQDNVYLITNILPVTPHDATAPAAPGGVTAAVDGQSVVLDWDAVQEADVVGYHVERSLSPDGPWTRLTGPAGTTATSFTDMAVPASGGTGYYRVLAADYSGTVSTAASPVEVALPEVDEAPIRINAGGGAITLGGVQWSADQYFEGGKTYSNSQVTQIAGTTDDAIYQSERSATTNLGTFGYNIPVDGGGYVVRLHFAEIYHGATGGGAGGTGKRVFSVNLEGGGTEVTNLDLNATVAPMTAHVIDVPVTVTDGNLDIDFTATVDQPKISAIEVLPQG